MAASVVAGSVVGASSSTSITKPTGYTDTANDLILVLLQSSVASAAPTAPTGFTSLTTRTDGASGDKIFSTVAWKLNSGSETWPKAWTAGTSSTFNVWSCVILRGNDTTTPIDANGQTGVANGGGTTGSIAALTASVAGDALVVLFTDELDVAVTTWPSGVTEYAPASNATGNGMDTGTKTGLASGSTGTLSITTGTNPGTWQAFAVLVKAAGSGAALTQNLSEKISALDTRVSQPGKRPSEAFSLLESASKNVQSPRSESFSVLDASSTTALHRISGDATSATDTTQRARGALWSIVDAFSGVDSLTRKNITKGLFDALAALESARFNTSHAQGEVTALLDALQRLPSHLLSDGTSAATTTSSAKGALLQLLDSFSSKDALAQKALLKALSESISALDTRQQGVAHQLLDALVLVEVLSKLPGHLLNDRLSGLDSLAANLVSGGQNYSKLLTDSHSATDARVALLVKALAEQLLFVDSSSWRVTHTLLEQFSQTEKLVAGRALLLALQDWFSSTEVAQETKQVVLAKGHLAVLSLAISMLLGVNLAISSSAALGAVLRAPSNALAAQPWSVRSLLQGTLYPPTTTLLVTLTLL